jgi:hypothetical protein
MIAKILPRVSVLFIVLLITGCSTFSFIFERLDWFIIWRLDNMFDLTEEQENKAQPDIVALQQWIRAEGFPETIDRLETLLALWEADKPESAYHHLMSSMESLNHLYLNAMKQGVVKFSLRLTEKNARHYREYSDPQQEDWFDATRSLEARIEHDTDRLENWFGHLNDTQITVIKNRASLTENEQQIRIDNHIKWRDAYLQAAINRDAALLSAWLDDLSIFWTSEYAMLKQHNNQQYQALVFELFPTLSLKQKRHASENIKGWIDKLRDVLPEN